MHLFRKKPNPNPAHSIAKELEINPALLIRRDDISIGQQLGKGGFGTVFKAAIPGNDRCVAKQINVARVSTKDLPLLRTELQVWSEVNHPNCLKFIGVSLEPKEYLLICELMEGGSLQEANERAFCSRRPPLEAALIVARLQSIASAMVYLHDRSIIHRDLKSGNILLAKGAERLVVADFGLARYCGREGGEQMTAETGSYRWMAPEVMRHESYDRPCDVYSFAILAWEIMTYDVPFNTMSPVEAAFAVALHSERPQLPRHCPAALASLVAASWHQEAAKRPTFTQVHSSLREIAISLMTETASNAPTAAPAATPAAATSSGSAATLPRSPSKRKLAGDSDDSRHDSTDGGGASGLPRVSSKRKMSGELGATSPRIKRPESISSGLNSLVNLRDASGHGGKSDSSQSAAITPCA